MRLDEALRTGKPFKRSNEVLWTDPCDGSSSDGWRCYLREHVLATDYETKNEPVTITKEKFWEAAAEAFDFTRSHEPITRLRSLAQKLGLE